MRTLHAGITVRDVARARRLYEDLPAGEPEGPFVLELVDDD